MISLIKEIKKKKELSDIADSIVKQAIQNYLLKHHIELKETTPSDKKIILKEVRADLRLFSGRFQKNTKNRLQLLNQNKIKELLKTHASTSERLPYYQTLKAKINSLKISSILDLGCGLNPIAIANPNLEYYASDIKEDELSLIKRYFKKNKIKGKVFICDLTKSFNNFPKTDLTIIFKVLDILPSNHSLSENLLNSIKSKYILVSFSTKKLSGKPMNFPQRLWFERILRKNAFSFDKFQSQNEIFYLITK